MNTDNSREIDEKIKKVLNRIATIPQRDIDGMAYVPTDELVYEMEESLYIFFDVHHQELQKAREEICRNHLETLEDALNDPDLYGAINGMVNGLRKHLNESKLDQPHA